MVLRVFESSWYLFRNANHEDLRARKHEDRSQNLCARIRSMKTTKRDYTVDAVARSLSILETMAQENREMGVLEISQKVGIHSVPYTVS